MLGPTDSAKVETSLYPIPQEAFAVIALEVWIDGVKACVAGVGDKGVLIASVTWVGGPRGDDLDLRVGGLTRDPDSPPYNYVTCKGGAQKHVDWVLRQLSVGAEIRIHVVDVPTVDLPLTQKRASPL